MKRNGDGDHQMHTFCKCPSWSKGNLAHLSEVINAINSRHGQQCCVNSECTVYLMVPTGLRSHSSCSPPWSVQTNTQGLYREYRNTALSFSRNTDKISWWRRLLTAVARWQPQPASFCPNFLWKFSFKNFTTWWKQPQSLNKRQK